MICNLENVSEIIKKEGLEILIVSYGGCCSNSLTDALEKEGYKCTTQIWKNILCHCPKYINCDIPIIYIYNNPIYSFSSMKRRNNGFWDTNQRKLSNNQNINLSDENLLKLMIKQFHNWTDVKRDNVLIIKSNELFKDEIVTKLNSFLNTYLKHFPLKYIKPKTYINKEDIYLFEKYKDEIDKINE
tara:strand:+ start:71 stop:628 length:558 start_codon:yes stop_codon:yes gene_type:complete